MLYDSGVGDAPGSNRTHVMKTPDKWDRRRAQVLINKGLWLEKHTNALKLAQSVICEKWHEAIESDDSPSFYDFASEVDDAVDLFLEVVRELRGLEPLPSDYDGSVFLRYGCPGGHGVQLLPPLPVEEDKRAEPESKPEEEVES